HIPTTKLTFIVIASTAIFTLSLHDALPIFSPTDSVAQIRQSLDLSGLRECRLQFFLHLDTPDHSDDRLVIEQKLPPPYNRWTELDRKSTRLNSSHVAISYAVFCLKKENTPN